MKDGKFAFGGPDNNKTMGTLHMSQWQDGKPKQEVECITLETLFKNENIEHVDLMKIDIEGSEYEVLGSSSFKAVAPKIDIVIGESHKWAGRNENQLRESLKNNGFNFQWLPGDAQLFVATK
jgi:FkbM family methyltransferase